jgi:hypothetical protein
MNLIKDYNGYGLTRTNTARNPGIINKAPALIERAMLRDTPAKV